MKKIFIDTNIFIDIIIQRDSSTLSLKEILPYLHHSQIFLSTLSIHIAFYSLKIKPNSAVYRKIKDISKYINIVDLSTNITNLALQNFYLDFEDTLQYYSALDQNCDYILTRDIKDFNKLKKQVPSDIQIVDTLSGVQDVK